MEPYIPLVKAIIISSMFSWGTSSVTITDQYILKEFDYKNQDSRKEVKEYQIYDLKRNFVHNYNWMVLNDLELVSIDSLHEIQIKGVYNDPNKQLISTSLRKEEFNGFKCKVETNVMVQYPITDDEESFKYSDISYFAKIPWIDVVLDTDEKRKFAGFDSLQYSPYHYLIYNFEQYPNQVTKDQVLRIIEKTEVDTTLIHKLLSSNLGDH